MGLKGNRQQKERKGEEPAETKFVNIATGGTAGTYFPLGGAIADILNKMFPA